VSLGEGRQDRPDLICGMLDRNSRPHSSDRDQGDARSCVLRSILGRENARPVQVRRAQAGEFLNLPEVGRLVKKLTRRG
jgi:hypothetical protein